MSNWILALLAGIAIGLSAFFFATPYALVVTIQDQPIDIIVRTTVGDITLHADGRVTYPLENLDQATVEFWNIVQHNVRQALKETMTQEPQEVEADG